MPSSSESSLPPHNGSSEPGAEPLPEGNRPGHHPLLEQDKPLNRDPRPATIVEVEAERTAMAGAAAANQSTSQTRFPPRVAGLTGWISKVFTGGDRFAFVTVIDGELVARHGPWVVHTPLRNIRDVSLTGPYRWFKVAGPAHLSFSDHGITFATNRSRGVRISFKQPVAGIEPTGRMRHPNLTVTPADPEGLARTLGLLADDDDYLAPA